MAIGLKIFCNGEMKYLATAQRRDAKLFNCRRLYSSFVQKF